MSQINRKGTFRGRIADAGVGATKTSQIPQWIASLVATEHWDEETQTWVDWSQYDETEIIAYLCLFDKKFQKCLNCTQVEKVLNWDGCDLEELAGMDLSEAGIQFRIEENTYTPEGGEPRTSLQVDWIDEFDATPGRTVRKLDPAELKKLNTQYAKAMKPKAKPASAASAKKDEPPRAPGQIKKVDKPKTPKAPPAAAPPTAPPPVNGPTGKSSKDEAWSDCVESKLATVTDGQLATAWQDSVKGVIGNTPDKDATPEQWWEIREKVLEIVMF